MGSRYADVGFSGRLDPGPAFPGVSMEAFGMAPPPHIRTLHAVTTNGRTSGSGAATSSPPSRVLAPAQSAAHSQCLSQSQFYLASFDDFSDRSVSIPLVLPMPPDGSPDKPHRGSSCSGAASGQAAGNSPAAYDPIMVGPLLPHELQRIPGSDQGPSLQLSSRPPRPMRHNSAPLLLRYPSKSRMLAIHADRPNPTVPGAERNHSAGEFDALSGAYRISPSPMPGTNPFHGMLTSEAASSFVADGQDLREEACPAGAPSRAMAAKAAATLHVTSADVASAGAVFMPSPLAPVAEDTYTSGSGGGSSDESSSSGGASIYADSRSSSGDGAAPVVPVAAGCLPPAAGTGSASTLFLPPGLAAGSVAAAGWAVLLAWIQSAFQAWLRQRAQQAAAEGVPPQSTLSRPAPSLEGLALPSLLPLAAGAALLLLCCWQLWRSARRRWEAGRQPSALASDGPVYDGEHRGLPQGPLPAPGMALVEEEEEQESSQPISPFTTEASALGEQSKRGADFGQHGRGTLLDAARGHRASGPGSNPSLRGWAGAVVASTKQADDPDPDAEVHLGDANGPGALATLTSQLHSPVCAAHRGAGGTGAGDARCRSSDGSSSTCTSGTAQTVGTATTAATMVNAAPYSGGLPAPDLKPAAGAIATLTPGAVAGHGGHPGSSVGAGTRWLRMALPGLHLLTHPRRRAPQEAAVAPLAPDGATPAGPGAGAGYGVRSASAYAHTAVPGSGAGAGGGGGSALPTLPHLREISRRASGAAFTSAAGVDVGGPSLAAIAASLASSAMASAASSAVAFCSGILRTASTPGQAASALQAFAGATGGGAGGAGGGSTHNGSQYGSSGTGGAQTRSSSGVVHMVSDLLPRVTGGWTSSNRSVSANSLTALAEAAVGGGSVGPGGGGGGGGGGGAHALLLSTAEAVVVRKPAFSDLPQNAGRVQVLSVDDEPVNQQVMRALLWAAEYEVLEARSGEEALEVVRGCEVLPDLVLLDVTLGGDVSGFEVCREIRREYSPGELPVIMITCSSLEEDVIRGLAVGANDYMIKPLRNLELMARIKTQLALKRSIRVAAEARVNMSLLASILPANVIRQLKQGVTLIAQFHQEVTILFSGFTNLATEWPTEQIILMLNNMFTAFDRLCDRLGVYKVETIGDAYMIVSGHDGVADHAPRMLRMAAAMLGAVKEMRGFDGRELQIRVGIHTGPAHSGVVGLSRPRYCFFGDTVNTASRMESTGFPMAVQVSEATMCAVQSRPEWASLFEFAPCGPRDIKGKGTMHTYLLRVGLYEKALSELAAAAAARASATAKRRRASLLLASANVAALAVATAEAASNASSAGRAAGGAGAEAGVAAAAAPAAQGAGAAAADSTTPAEPEGAPTAAGAAVPAPTTPQVGLASPSILAPPLPPSLTAAMSFPTAGSSGGSGGRGRAPVVPLGSGEQCPSDTDFLKFASWRYHHAHTGLDMASSAGTNILYDNPLGFVIGSNNGPDASMLDTFEMSPSGDCRRAAAVAAAAAAAFSCGGAAPEANGAAHSVTAAAAAAQQTDSAVFSPSASPRRSFDAAGTAFSVFGGGGGGGGGGGAVGPWANGRTGPSRTASGLSANAVGLANGGGSGGRHAATTAAAAGGGDLNRSASGASNGALGAATAGADTPRLSAAARSSSPSAAAVAGLGNAAAAADDEPPLRQVPPEMLTQRSLNGKKEGAAAAQQWVAAAPLRRSRLRTSEELTAAAAAAVAAAMAAPSRTSVDDEAGRLAAASASAAAASTSAAAASTPSRDSAAGGTGTSASGPDGLTGQLQGWSLLIGALDVADLATHGSDDVAAAATTETLGTWIGQSPVNRDRTLGSDPPRQMSPSPGDDPKRRSLSAVGSAGDDAVPQVALAAEALAAAVDSALYGIAGGGAGDALSASPRPVTVPPMGRAGSPREASADRPLRETQSASPRGSLQLPPTGSGFVAAVVQKFNTQSLGAASSSGPLSSRGSGAHPPPTANPHASRLYRTTSQGGASIHRMAYERAAGTSGADAHRSTATSRSPAPASPDTSQTGAVAAAAAMFAGEAHAAAAAASTGVRGADGGRRGASTDAQLVGLPESWSTVPVSRRPVTTTGTTAASASCAPARGVGSAAMARGATAVLAPGGYGGLYSGPAHGVAGLGKPRRRAATGHGFSARAEAASAAAWGRNPADVLSTSGGAEEEEVGGAAAGSAQWRASCGPSSPAAGSDVCASPQAHAGQVLSRVDSQGSHGLLAAGGSAGGVGSALLVSHGSLGGVSIIGTGWSNLYEPAQTRPRPTTDIMYASGDLEDAAGHTPGSAVSHSASGQPHGGGGAHLGRSHSRPAKASPSLSHGRVSGAGGSAGLEQGDGWQRAPRLASRGSAVVGTRFGGAGATSPSVAPAGGSNSLTSHRSRSMDVAYRHRPLSPRPSQSPLSPSARTPEERHLTRVCEEHQLAASESDFPQLFSRAGVDGPAGPLGSPPFLSMEHAAVSSSGLPGYEHLEEYSRKHSREFPSAGLAHGLEPQNGPMGRQARLSPGAVTRAGASSPSRRMSVDVNAYGHPHARHRAHSPGAVAAAGPAIVRAGGPSPTAVAAAAADAAGSQTWAGRHSVDAYAPPRGGLALGGAASPPGGSLLPAGVQPIHPAPPPPSPLPQSGMPPSPMRPERTPTSAMPAGGNGVPSPRTAALRQLMRPPGPGAFGSPVGAMAGGSAAPLAAGSDRAAGGGGLDLARMLARATDAAAAEPPPSTDELPLEHPILPAPPLSAAAAQPPQEAQRHAQAAGAGPVAAGGTGGQRAAAEAPPNTAWAPQPLDQQVPAPPPAQPGATIPAGSRGGGGGPQGGHDEHHRAAHAHGSHGVHGPHVGLMRTLSHQHQTMLTASRLDPVDECGGSSAAATAEVASLAVPVASSGGGGSGSGLGEFLRQASAGAAAAQPPGAAATERPHADVRSAGPNVKASSGRGGAGATPASGIEPSAVEGGKSGMGADVPGEPLDEESAEVRPPSGDLPGAKLKKPAIARIFSKVRKALSPR